LKEKRKQKTNIEREQLRLILLGIC
jgi:hypothetical protein